jgi:hypothetical protein
VGIVRLHRPGLSSRVDRLMTRTLRLQGRAGLLGFRLGATQRLPLRTPRRLARTFARTVAASEISKRSVAALPRRRRLGNTDGLRVKTGFVTSDSGTTGTLAERTLPLPSPSTAVTETGNLPTSPKTWVTAAPLALVPSPKVHRGVVAPDHTSTAATENGSGCPAVAPEGNLAVSCGPAPS